LAYLKTQQLQESIDEQQGEGKQQVIYRLIAQSLYDLRDSAPGINIPILAGCHIKQISVGQGKITLDSNFYFCYAFDKYHYHKHN
jgi:hypothetical protein